MVGTTAAFVGTTIQGRGRPVIQNLGPGDVYLDMDPVLVTPDTGIKLTVNSVYEVPTSVGTEELSLVATLADTDVRVIMVGEG